jgi:crossover junction endodeoxyribonuclease RusA
MGLNAARVEERRLDTGSMAEATARRPLGSSQACKYARVPANSTGLPVEFVVFGVPASSQSANKARKHSWVSAVKAAAQAQWTIPPVDVKVKVTITHYQRGGTLPDVDNMAKPILDAITGTVWVDDRQVDSATPGRVDLDGMYRIAGLSMVLAEGFSRDEPFVHVRIEDFTDQEYLP